MKKVKHIHCKMNKHKAETVIDAKNKQVVARGEMGGGISGIGEKD